MKKILFFILGVTIFWPLHLILAFTYGTTSSAEPGWYQNLWDEGFFGKILFILLGIVIFPMVWFMRLFYSFWEDLGD